MYECSSVWGLLWGRGGEARHGRSGEYQKKTLSALCMLEHNQLSLRLEKPRSRVGLEARLYRVIGWDNIYARMVTESDTLDFNIMYTLYEERELGLFKFLT